MGKTFVYNTGNPKSSIDEVQIEIGVFFDGTLNNLKNTELRQKYRDGKNKIEGADSKETILDKEKAIEATRKQQEKEYGKLKNEKISENDSEYEQYLKASHRGWIDKQGVDNSFSNDYTNVARMYLSSKRDTYGVYVEGIGTLDNNRDVDDGFQYGSGKTGIRGKVRLGCEKVADRIKKIKKNLINPKAKLKIVYIDTFGFSRGAAAARNFSYEINGNKRPQDIEVKKSRKIVGYREEYSSAHEAGFVRVPVYEDIWVDKDKKEVDPQYLDNGKLPKYGFLGYYLLSKDILSKEELEDLELQVRFIGVYDTVSSYEEFGDMGTGKRVGVKGTVHSTRGPSYYFGNDVEQLQLKNPGPYLKAVHFTAMDEHRENFSLTTFPGSIEKEFPGVHCDIGGAYENGMEVVDEIETSNHKPLWFLNNRKQQLIDDYWYNDDEIEINNKFLNIITGGNVYRKITGTRFLRKEYSYIPLHFMGEHGNQYFNHQLIHDDVLNTSYSLEHDEYLPSAKQFLYHYVFEDGARWDFKNDEQVAKDKAKKEQEKLLEEQLEAKPIENKLPIAVKDNIYVKPPLEFKLPIPPTEKKEITYEDGVDENGEKIKIGNIEGVTVIGYSKQSLLRILRNKYLHWSANRDWLGMDPNSDYKRREY